VKQDKLLFLDNAIEELFEAKENSIL